jgi:hypothetical protein
MDETLKIHPGVMMAAAEEGATLEIYDLVENRTRPARLSSVETFEGGVTLRFVYIGDGR